MGWTALVVVVISLHQPASLAVSHPLRIETPGLVEIGDGPGATEHEGIFGAPGEVAFAGFVCVGLLDTVILTGAARKPSRRSSLLEWPPS